MVVDTLLFVGIKDRNLCEEICFTLLNKLLDTLRINDQINFAVDYNKLYLR